MAANSEIRICNLALARLGCELISDFDESSKAARMCKVIYPMLRDELISEHGWSCMRKLADLVELENEESSLGSYVYQRPSDCVVPLDILPLGSGTRWTILGDTIVTDTEDAELMYIYQETNPEKFNWPFMRALVNRLIIYLVPSMIGDSDKAEKYLREAEARIALAKTDDANTGSEYRYPDEDANYDSFVNPDGAITQD